MTGKRLADRVLQNAMCDCGVQVGEHKEGCRYTIWFETARRTRPYVRAQEIYWRQYTESGLKKPIKEAIHIEQFCDWLLSNGYEIENTTYEISQCPHCLCMTKTIVNECGKCGEPKED